MLTDEQIAKFRKDGFVLGGHVLDDGRVDELRAELERVIEEKDSEDGPKPVRLVNLSRKDEHPVWQVVNIWQASKAYQRLLSEPKIAEEIAQLLDATQVRVWHDQIQYKPAAKGGVNHWHQDIPYWPTLKGGDQVTAWVALDDADEDNGCMSMVPGSQAWGDQVAFLHTLKGIENMPSDWEGNALTVRTTPVKKGSVHYHHGFVWHGSGANTSGRPRRAIAMHYMNQDTLYNGENRMHPMEPLVTVQPGEQLAGDAFPLVWAGDSGARSAQEARLDK